MSAKPVPPHWMPIWRTKVERASTMRASMSDLRRLRVEVADQLLDRACRLPATSETMSVLVRSSTEIFPRGESRSLRAIAAATWRRRRRRG